MIPHTDTYVAQDANYENDIETKVIFDKPQYLEDHYFQTLYKQPEWIPQDYLVLFELFLQEINVFFLPRMVKVDERCEELMDFHKWVMHMDAKKKQSTDPPNYARTERPETMHWKFDCPVMIVEIGYIPAKKELMLPLVITRPCAEKLGFYKLLLIQLCMVVARGDFQGILIHHCLKDNISILKSKWEWEEVTDYWGEKWPSDLEMSRLQKKYPSIEQKPFTNFFCDKNKIIRTITGLYAEKGQIALNNPEKSHFLKLEELIESIHWTKGIKLKGMEAFAYADVLNNQNYINAKHNVKAELRQIIAAVPDQYDYPREEKKECLDLLFKSRFDAYEKLKHKPIDTRGKSFRELDRALWKPKKEKMTEFHLQYSKTNFFTEDLKNLGRKTRHKLILNGGDRPLRNRNPPTTVTSVSAPVSAPGRLQMIRRNISNLDGDGHLFDLSIPPPPVRHALEPPSGSPVSTISTGSKRAVIDNTKLVSLSTDFYIKSETEYRQLLKDKKDQIIRSIQAAGSTIQRVKLIKAVKNGEGGRVSWPEPILYHLIMSGNITITGVYRTWLSELFSGIPQIVKKAEKEAMKTNKTLALALKKAYREDMTYYKSAYIEIESDHTSSVDVDSGSKSVVSMEIKSGNQSLADIQLSQIVYIDVNPEKYKYENPIRYTIDFGENNRKIIERTELLKARGDQFVFDVDSKIEDETRRFVFVIILTRYYPTLKNEIYGLWTQTFSEDLLGRKQNLWDKYQKMFLLEEMQFRESKKRNESIMPITKDDGFQNEDGGEENEEQEEIEEIPEPRKTDRSEGDSDGDASDKEMKTFTELSKMKKFTQLSAEERPSFLQLARSRTIQNLRYFPILEIVNISMNDEWIDTGDPIRYSVRLNDNVRIQDLKRSIIWLMYNEKIPSIVIQADSQYYRDLSIKKNLQTIFIGKLSGVVIKETHEIEYSSAMKKVMKECQSTIAERIVTPQRMLMDERLYQREGSTTVSYKVSGDIHESGGNGEFDDQALPHEYRRNSGSEGYPSRKPSDGEDGKKTGISRQSSRQSSVQSAEPSESESEQQDTEKFEVESLIGDRTRRDGLQMCVKWVGHADITWESVNNLIEDGLEPMILAYFATKDNDEKKYNSMTDEEKFLFQLQKQNSEIQGIPQKIKKLKSILYNKKEESFVFFIVFSGSRHVFKIPYAFAIQFYKTELKNLIIVLLRSTYKNYERFKIEYSKKRNGQKLLEELLDDSIQRILDEQDRQPASRFRTAPPGSDIIGAQSEKSIFTSKQSTKQMKESGVGSRTEGDHASQARKRKRDLKEIPTEENEADHRGDLKTIITRISDGMEIEYIDDTQAFHESGRRTPHSVETILLNLKIKGREETQSITLANLLQTHPVPVVLPLINSYIKQYLRKHIGDATHGIYKKNHLYELLGINQGNKRISQLVFEVQHDIEDNVLKDSSTRSYKKIDAICQMDANRKLTLIVKGISVNKKYHLCNLLKFYGEEYMMSLFLKKRLNGYTTNEEIQTLFKTEMDSVQIYLQNIDEIEISGHPPSRASQEDKMMDIIQPLDLTQSSHLRPVGSVRGGNGRKGRSSAERRRESPISSDSSPKKTVDWSPSETSRSGLFSSSVRSTEKRDQGYSNGDEDMADSGEDDST